MDLQSISAALQSMKVAKDMVGALEGLTVDINAKTQIFHAQEKVGEAQDQLRELREEAFQLQQENHDLRRQLNEANDWDAVRKKYLLVQTTGGATVYQFSDQPTHYACPSCFNTKQLHFLQPDRKFSGTWTCKNKNCGAEYPVDPRSSGGAYGVTVDPGRGPRGY